MLSRRPHFRKLLFIALLIIVLAVGVWYGARVLQEKKEPEEAPPFSQEGKPAEIFSTEANLKVAFIGDSGYGESFERVLKLIKSEEADLVLHQGDFDYVLDPAGFFAEIDAILGPKFPYFASVGNHDATAWEGYAQLLKERMTRLNLSPDDPDLSDQKYSLTYKGLKMVFVGENGKNAEFAQFLGNQLSKDDHLWRICSWHKNQTAMQVEGKGNEMGWEVYETCRSYGAIIATGHAHSYHRTKTLKDLKNQFVDEACPDPGNLCVGPGKTFVFVAGLGGHSIRRQYRCLPSTYPYGCNGEWAMIYTSDQGATYGVLFIEFNIAGNPHKAQGYFKNISGERVDEFEITAFAQ